MARPRGKESESRAKPRKGETDDAGASGPLNAIPELMRRALTLGLSGFFVTEEVFRKALGDTLPRDWIEFMVEQSARTRAEFVERLGAEVGRTLDKTDLAEVLGQLLEDRTIEIVAQVRIKPKAAGATSATEAQKRRRS